MFNLAAPYKYNIKCFLPTWSAIRGRVCMSSKRYAPCVSFRFRHLLLKSLLDALTILIWRQLGPVHLRSKIWSSDRLSERSQRRPRIQVTPLRTFFTRKLYKHFYNPDTAIKHSNFLTEFFRAIFRHNMFNSKLYKFKLWNTVQHMIKYKN